MIFLILLNKKLKIVVVNACVLKQVEANYRIGPDRRANFHRGQGRGALSSKLPRFLFFLSTIFFFQTNSIEDAVLRRFYSCHFLAKRHSLGVTGVFL